MPDTAGLRPDIRIRLSVFETTKKKKKKKSDKTTTLLFRKTWDGNDSDIWCNYAAIWYGHKYYGPKRDFSHIRTLPFFVKAIKKKHEKKNSA
jgi:hypothetical protein